MNLKRVLIGITGGISAYKVPDIIRDLKRAGISVTPLLTQSAHEFVTPMTLGTVAGVKPVTSMWDDLSGIQHIALARDHDAMVIVPATAHTIARLAHGLADDLLAATFLAFTGPRLIVPAMNTDMYLNPATQDNLALLAKRGISILGPGVGEMACGTSGPGRLIASEMIVDRILALAFPPIDLTGRHILITAGPTTERIDSVRVLTNLSSGKLGNMLARMAAFNGAKVHLVTTVPCGDPALFEIVQFVESVAEMETAVRAEIAACDVLYMAAAVSDYTVSQASETKLRRTAEMTLNLTGTPDILAGLSDLKGNKRFIGFCLDDNDLLKVARDKLVRKNLDSIIANRPETIGQHTRTVSILNRQNDDVIIITDASVMALAHTLLKLAL